MASVAELERALINADKAGDTDAARKLAAVIKRSREQAVTPSGVPTYGEEGIQAIPKPEPEPTMGEQLIGAGEAALALGTGATGGLAGAVVGTAKGMAEQILAGEFGTHEAQRLIEKAGRAGAEALTYAPRTEPGREQTQAIAEVLQPLEAFMPLAGEIGAVTRAIQPRAAIPRAAPKKGVFLDKLGIVESGGDYTAVNKFGYTGKYQFGKSTAKPHLKKIGSTWEEFKTNPAIQEQVARLHTETNIAGLEKAGIPATELNVWMAHNQGLSGAKQILSGQISKNVQKGIANNMDNSGLPPTPENYMKVWSKKFSETEGVDGIALKAAAPITVSPEQAAIQVERGIRAEALREPIQLTKGQKTREFAQQQFERETAKQAELGAPLRQRFQDQNEAIMKNFDKFVDMSGAEVSDLRAVGTVVDKSIRDMAARDKAAIRVAYKNAEKSSEGKVLVTLDKLVEHMNDQKIEAIEPGVLKTTKSRIIDMGAAIEDGEGNLIPNPITLKDANKIRQSINQNTDTNPVNIRQSTIMKSHIDDIADVAGGELYKKARDLRTEYANKYENIALVKDIIGKKRTRGDRKIALEDVFRRSVISGSADDVSQLKKLLMSSGAEGKQAWKEIQGATLRHIKEQATKNVARDERGNPIVSAAQLDRTVKTLDKGGKLDIVLGKKTAREIRLLNDISKDILTVPPGAVNTSNTSSAILAAMDIAISGTAGVPAPILSGIKMIRKYMNDKKIIARVNAALGRTQKGKE